MGNGHRCCSGGPPLQSASRWRLGFDKWVSSLVQKQIVSFIRPYLQSWHLTHILVARSSGRRDQLFFYSTQQEEGYTVD